MSTRAIKLLELQKYTHQFTKTRAVRCDVSFLNNHDSVLKNKGGAHSWMALLKDAALWRVNTAVCIILYSHCRSESFKVIHFKKERNLF